MPRRRVQPPESMSLGCAIMLLGCISLLESDEPYDSSSELGTFLVAVGLYVFKKQQKARIAALNHRYGPRDAYRTDRTRAFVDELMGRRTSDRIFKDWFRINRTSFYRLLNLIKDDPVFISQGRKPQMPPKYQLATFLARYGCLPGIKVATLFQVAEGTIYNHSRRVVHALRRLKPLYLSWPSPPERVKLKTAAQTHGFPGAIGVVDGTLIELADKPRGANAVAYRTRKKTWGLNMQAGIDHSGKFISYDLGWPGCTPDVTIWKESHLWLHRDSYLNPDEWIMGDRGYPLSVYLITLFREGTWDQPDNPVRVADCRRWNKAFSSQRMTVEHAFGRLKGRFPFLQQLNAYDLENACKVIEALLVIHNIMIELNDLPDDIRDVDLNALMQRERENRPVEGDFPATVGNLRSNNQMRVMGARRRTELVNYWLDHEHAL